MECGWPGLDGLLSGRSSIDIDLDAIFREFDLTSSRRHRHRHRPVVSESGNVEDGEGGKSERERELRLKLQHSQEENAKLQAVISDLTQVNKRWQKYNSERQIYVQKLLVTIQDQQEQLNTIAPTTATRQSPLCELELERLRNNERKLKEKVSILEFQVKAHRDDWEAELNEKKQALQNKEIAERKLSELLAEMQLLSCRQCSGGDCSPLAPPSPSPSRLYRSAVTLPPSRHSSTTSISTTSEDPAERWNVRPDDTSYSRCSTVPLRSFVQIPIAKSSSVPEGSAPKFPPTTSISSCDGSETLSAENVICLRCGRVFPPDMHLQFLDHFPKCQIKNGAIPKV